MKIVVNGELRDVEAGTTVAAVLEQLGARVGAVAVEVNRDVVPRAEHSARALHDGDKVEIVHFVGGG
ncbi:MAG: sulfur carrier protein ThiS [Deltaproteobacteria bacterium]|nr:sulfur carrier protein ThiS [Deltaproteobacteria bacterium]